MNIDPVKEGESPFVHPIDDRGQWGEIFEPLFSALNSDCYGKHFENAVFEMHPYCWCDKDDCPQCGQIETQANFLHKPTGLAVRWYKYAFRATETNCKVIRPAELRKIVQECIDSLDGVVVNRATNARKITDIIKPEIMAKVKRNGLYGKRGK